MGSLKIPPKPGGGSKCLGKEDRGLRGDGALSSDDLADAHSRNTHLIGHGGLAEPHRLEKFFIKDLSRGNEGGTERNG